MADAGIGEAAILAAAAESAAAAGTTAAVTLPAVLETGAAVGGGLAATAPLAAEAAVPALALAAPEAVAPVVGTVGSSVLPVTAETLAPTVASTVPAATEAPAVTGGLLAGGETPSISLLSTQSEPVTGGLLGQGAAEYPLPAAGDLPSLSQTIAAQDIGFGPGMVAPGFAGETLPAGAGLPTTPAIQTGAYAPSLLDKLGHWWETSSLGDKLSVGGKGLAGISAAQKVVAPTAGSSAGPKTTIKPGSVGQPRGGEQALAAVVEALLKRRDAYTGAAYGTPVAYRPRGLLG